MAVGDRRRLAPAVGTRVRVLCSHETLYGRLGRVIDRVDRGSDLDLAFVMLPTRDNPYGRSRAEFCIWLRSSEIQVLP